MLLIAAAISSTVITATVTTEATAAAALVSITGLLVVPTATLEATIGAAGAVKGLIDTDDATVEPAAMRLMDGHSSNGIIQQVLLLVVHSAQGGIGLLISRKAHEAESTTAQSCAILDDDLDILG